MTWRDLGCRRRLQALERIGLNRGWCRELSTYYRGLTLREVRADDVEARLPGPVIQPVFRRA
jgi:hypothetical protein